MDRFGALRASVVALLFSVIVGLLGAGSARAESVRGVYPLDQAWTFIKGDLDGAQAPGFDASAWAPVALPHTWNADDGEDGGGYYRGPGWYRVTFTRPAQAGRLWLEFDGAALAADAWVNGVHVGRHEGGYARFRFDVTEAARRGDNILAVRVDNAQTTHIAPLGGDFTVFGGLHRPVRLIVVAPTHIDLGDYGGPGVYMTPSDVSATGANLSFVVRLANASGQARRVRVRTRLADADGRSVLDIVTNANIAARGRAEISQDARLANPRLWDGRTDPHLYRLSTELLDSSGRVIDRVDLRTGIRATIFDAERGFILNGRPHPLYGVNYQLPGRPRRGTAVHEFEIDQDVGIIDDLGATAVRLAHVQHAQRAYDLADQLGLAVWTEAPLVSAADASEAFLAITTQQMRELIRQNQHHPSVVVWGIGNELYAADEPVNAALALMQQVAREEDSSRPTTYAHCCQDDLDRITTHADLNAYNRYFGWYRGEMERIGAWADEVHARAPTRPFAVSEYGAGASVLQQRDPPDRPTTDGPWHPEQYQTLFHETYWRALRDRPFLWANLIWVGFDFASDDRDEGDRAGINDKGLVTYDRAVRKDSYYWYQANWSASPMAHILNRRISTHTAEAISVRAYSNLDALSLYVNGALAGEAPVRDHVAVWAQVRLAPGLNRLEVRGAGGVVDTIFLSRVQ